MPLPDAYQLANLPLGKKLAYSLGLLAGLAAFFSAFFASVTLLSWGRSPHALLDWGRMLLALEQASAPLYWGLTVAHILSLLAIAWLTRLLLRRLPMPQAGKTILTAGATALSGVDLLLWLCVSSFSLARVIAGPVVLVTGSYLLGLSIFVLRAMWWRVRWIGGDGRKVEVVVVGGGFAGLQAALGLDRALGYHPDLRITVLDRHNYFLFPPLLPSVATGAIEMRQVAYPFRRVFEATNVVFKKETVERIDPDARCIHARVDTEVDPQSGGPREVLAKSRYDLLVLAPGSRPNTFGTPGANEHAFFVGSAGRAVALRNHVIDCFEHAARDEEPRRREALLRFVVVGAGPTGVELAAELRELVDQVLLGRYPEIEAAEVEVLLVSAKEQILPGWRPQMVSAATKQLAAIGVRVLRGARVVRVGADAVTLGDGRVLPARTCAWCAGVKPRGLLTRSGLPLHGSGRVEVEADGRAHGYPDVFVLGDAAFRIDPATGRPYPPLGQVAHQQGRHTARNLVRLLQGRPTRPFRYFDYGALLSVGAHFAAVDLLGVRLSGAIAWFVWRTLYLGKLVGFGNKLRVVLDWTLDLLVERSIAQIHSAAEDRPQACAGATPSPPAAALTTARAPTADAAPAGRRAAAP